MKPAPFDYVRPDTIEEALEHLARGGGDAIVLAGGQTLLPLLALRMSQPGVLVDVNRIPALTGISRTATATRIAAVTRQREVLADETVAERLPALSIASRHVGHHQTRNRGTIGGSIALGEPAAEYPATAIALDAVVEVRSAAATRRVPVRELYLGPYETVLEPDEMIVAIDYPDWPAGTATLFREVARRPGDFALVGLVGAVAVESGRVSKAGIGWFGMGPTPIEAFQAADALVGQDVATLDVDGIAELAVADTFPFDDVHASAEYRRTVGRRAVARALREALGLTGGGGQRGDLRAAA